MNIRKIARVLLFILFLIVSAFILFILTISLTDYKPEKEIVLTNMPDAKAINSDTIEILTWNTGYAGLDKDMDFFYDGGKKVRTTKAKTLENLDSITSFISQVNSDFIFLQEVDKNSKRTYKIDMVTEIAVKKPDYAAIYATNYNVPFVPMPVLSPMGKVESGIMVLSKYVPLQSIRYAYPSEQVWIKQLFLLDRCFLVCRYYLNSGKQLVIINTHNSAFDSGGKQRNKEMAMLKDFVTNEFKQGNYVIAGGDWNQLPPIEEAKAYENIYTPYFRPHAIPDTLMPLPWKWVSDGNPTNRFVDEPYTKGTTKETILDFFLISPNVEVIETKRINKGYNNSDHNPVKAKFRLK